MGKRTGATTAAAVVGAVLSLSQPAFAQAPTAAPRLTGAYHILLSGKAQVLVKDAINGALRRLAKPQCQPLFTDFTDPSGRALSDTLAAWGKTPGEAMAALYFVEGDGSTQCRADKTRGAFTAPGNRVIFVCGTRFADVFARRTAGEILLIHELLHALGLGENPPTSAQITDAVWTRCGN